MVSVCNKLDYSESWTIEPNFQTCNTKVCYSRICLVALTFCFKKFHLGYVVKLPPTVYGHEKTYEKTKIFFRTFWAAKHLSESCPSLNTFYVWIQQLYLWYTAIAALVALFLLPHKHELCLCQVKVPALSEEIKMVSCLSVITDYSRPTEFPAFSHFLHMYTWMREEDSTVWFFFK